MKILFFCIFACLILAEISSGNIINVPSQEPTIQAGIDAALESDTVLIAPGTYTGDGNRDIDFHGKGVVLKSENGPQFTIIDSEGTYSDPHRGFYFHSGEDSTAVVDGFTIQGGRGPLDDPDGNWVGGGIMCDSSSSPKIINNTISGNSDGGICCSDSDPTISNNTISGNYHGPLLGEPGGGIYCDGSNPTVTNNTIFGNSDGGIDCYDSSPIITNTIFRANTSTEVNVDETSSPVITYCDIQDGWEGEGNIDSNPLFLDPDNGNYNICSQSPCIDAGDPDMTDPDGTRSDIGVFYPDHPECSFGNIRYVSTGGNDTSGDGSPGNPFRTIQHAINVSFHFDSVIVENGTYVEHIDFSGKSILVASNFLFSGNTLDIQNTIIDGNSGSTVVTFNSYEDHVATITGFTIRNGYSVSGGGILCAYSNPTISNNTISGNGAGGGPWGGGYGGGICCAGSNPTIINNTISGNSAPFGGGIYCRGNSNPAISNNTISGNSANRGGGIYCNNYSSPTITNTIIAFSAGGEAIFCDNSNPVLTCCDIYGNAGGDWVGCIFGLAGKNGNFSLDPLFCDTATGNYGLLAESPCASSNNSCSILIGACRVGCSSLQPVYLDIKPGSCPNPLNAMHRSDKGKAVFPVAVLGTADFDVPDIDPETVTLNGVSPVRWSYEDVSTPVDKDTDSCACTEDGADGFEDLTLKFDREAIIASLASSEIGQGGGVTLGKGIPYGNAEITGPVVQSGSPTRDNHVLSVEGQLSDGSLFEGYDCVVLMSKDAAVQIDEKPREIQLGVNHPNPFNPVTQIGFYLPEAAHVKLEVFNLLGQSVATLVNGDMEAGDHAVEWNGADAASGIYLYRLTADDYTESRKMLLLK